MLPTSQEIRGFLAVIQPFKALTRAELDRAARAAAPKAFDDGQTIYREGEAAESVWVVFKGRVVIFKQAPVEGRFPIETLGPGEIFGTLCRLGEDSGAYPCTGVSAGDTIALRLPERSFFHSYANNAGFARQACSLCSLRLASTLDLRTLDQAPVPVRIGQTLSRLHKVYGTRIPLTKRELAELVGTALETTFRCLAKLQRVGVVSSSRGQILVKKPERLAA